MTLADVMVKVDYSPLGEVVMGMFRIAASIGTMGAVSPYEKRTRLAKRSLRELREQTALLEQIADPGKAERDRARMEAVALARRERRDAAIAASQAQRAARMAIRARRPAVAPARIAVTALVIVWAVFFALGALGAGISGSVAGVLGCVVLAGAPVALLVLSRRRVPATR